MGANQGFQDWMPSQFADAVDNARGFMQPDRYDDDGTLPRDAQGWPLAPSRLVCWTTTGQLDFPINQVFKGSYTGPGEIRSEIAGTDIRNLVRSGNNVTFDVVVTSWPLPGVFAFSGPVQNVKILFPGTGSNYLRPEAAAQGGLFWVHRFMQAAGILDSNREITWASRKPAGYRSGYKPWESIFQWLMGYVNAPGSRTRAGWFQVPRMADANYQIQLAQLAAASLPGNVIQYWGLGNELWNNIYQPFFGPQGMGQPYNRANNTADPDFARINTPPTDAYERMNRLIALEFARMAKRFLSVFGQGAFGTRLRPVLEAQHANPWMITTPLSWLSLPAQVAEFGPVNSYCWSISSAPYPGGEWAEMDEVRSPTPESIVAGLRSGYSYDLPFMLAAADQWLAVKNQYGIPELTAYEGIGPHTDGPFAQANSVNKYGAHIHPDMRRLVADSGRGLRDRGYGACCYFVGYTGAYNPQDLFSLWTVNQRFGEDSPKMLGVKDLIALSGV